MCTVAGVGAGGTAREQGLSNRDDGETEGQGGPPRPSLCQGKGLGSLPLRVGSRLGICLGEGTPFLGPQPSSPHPRPQLVLPRKLPLVGPPDALPPHPLTPCPRKQDPAPLICNLPGRGQGPLYVRLIMPLL